MSDVQALERAILQLSESELREFRAWFAEFDGGIWDRKLESDAESGKLDALGDEAMSDYRAGRSTEL